MNGLSDGLPKLLMLVALLSVAGCSDFSAPGDQGTPRATLAKYHSALFGGDKQAFVECHAGPKPYKEIAAALFDVSRSMLDFQDALRERYGPDGWRTYIATMPPNPPSSYIKAIVPPERSKEWVAAHQFEEEGSQALFWHARRPAEKRLMVRKSGAWLIDISYEFGANGTANAFYAADKAAREATVAVKTAKHMSMPELVQLYAESYNSFFDKDNKKK